MGNYSRAHYLSFADDKQVSQFYAYISELEGVVAEQGWALEKQFRKRWCAFKRAENSKAAFGIGFDSRNTLYLYIKRVESDAKAFPVNISSYNEKHDQAEYLLEPDVKQLKGFIPLLQVAYRRTTGK